jgi:hypothetical protein
MMVAWWGLATRYPKIYYPRNLIRKAGSMTFKKLANTMGME